MEPPPRVLIVDDDPETLRLYGFALELMGCRVVAAVSGHDALRAVAETPPEVVVTDLAMPGMDGIELCRALKAESSTRDIPVVAVSGQALTTAGERARAAGCEEVLVKPCAPDHLYESIQRVMDLASRAKADAEAAKASSWTLRQRSKELRQESVRLRRREP